MLSVVAIGHASDFVVDLETVQAEDIFNNIWNVDPIATSASGDTRLYVAVGSDTFYVWAEGLLPDPYNNIYFDTDLNSSTGYSAWQWPNMGGDFRVTDANFFESTGTGWNWNQIAEVAHVRFDVEDKVAFMTAIDLDLFGEIDTLRLSFGGETIMMPARDLQTVEVDLF